MRNMEETIKFVKRLREKIDARTEVTASSKELQHHSLQVTASGEIVFTTRRKNMLRGSDILNTY